MRKIEELELKREGLTNELDFDNERNVITIKAISAKEVKAALNKLLSEISENNDELKPAILKLVDQIF